MEELKDKIAVVTGAGSGIGRATALALAREGATVMVTDIVPEAAAETVRLIREQRFLAQAYEMDVASPGEVARVAERIHRSSGPAGVLVNNAGISAGGLFVDSSPEAWEKVVSINLMGVVNVCRAFVPAMVDAGNPAHIVNVSSLLGFAGMRGVSAYCTTKFGVLGFSECLRAELSAHDIGVSTVCPGMIRTNIIANGILESSEMDIEEKSREIDEFYKKRNYPPERVAVSILRAIRKNRAVMPVAPEAWGAYYVKRWFPGLMGWLARREWV